jgi:hypothetical protein
MVAVSPRFLSPVLLVLFGLALAGCAGTPWAALPLLLSLLSLVVAGCADSHERWRDGAVADAGTDAGRDAGRDAPFLYDTGGGHYEECCVAVGPDGVGMLSSCFCPGGYSCNYGLGLTRCGDGLCTYAGSGTGCPVPDAGVELDAAAVLDAGGDWEPCCDLGPTGIGTVTTCFCPASFECNYGWFDRCGGDVCVTPGSPCPDLGPDAG